MTVVTEIYTVLAAMTLMCISSAKETPKMPSDEQCLNSVAESVVDLCFAVPNTHEVLTANAAEEVDYPCCICNEEMDDKAIMVGCGNIHCPNGEWFHPHCLNMAPTDIPVGDWFCCEDCERASIAPMGSAAAVKKKTCREILIHNLITQIQVQSRCAVPGSPAPGPP